MFATLGGCCATPNITRDRIGLRLYVLRSVISPENIPRLILEYCVSEAILNHDGKSLTSSWFAVVVFLIISLVGSWPGGASTWGGSRSISKLAGTDVISGSTSPAPTIGTFSTLHKNLVYPDGRRERISIQPNLARARIVTNELPTSQVFSAMATSDRPGVVGFITISPRSELVGRGSALAYVYRASQSKQTSVG